MTQVFLSHSSENLEVAKKIYFILSSQNVKMWASFNNIGFGEEWDKAIQSAMDESSHILVLASKASLDSSYVRAEIEYAINLNKTVIPMIIDDITLPLRWHTLQAISMLDEDEWQNQLAKLSLQLPKNIIEKLTLAIEHRDKYIEILDMLYKNPNWLSRNAISKAEVESNIIIDFFSKNYHSAANTAQLFYLCSP